MRKLLVAAITAAALTATAAPALAATTVPGHTGSRVDRDGNGIPDAGIVVSGHYTSLYAYDGAGDWYWDLGDGRVQGSVTGVDQLDQASLTTCDYVVNYRGTFENTPYQDSGWIMNNIRCSGVDRGNYNSTIVHRSDPRFRGTGYGPGWGPDWEYHHDSWSGLGNVARNDRY